MKHRNPRRRLARFFILILTAIPATVAFFASQAFQNPRDASSATATYSHGVLHLTIPYRGGLTLKLFPDQRRKSVKSPEALAPRLVGNCSSSEA